ncbi:DUF488 domain-containing protein [Aestuariicella hydrocarbonica]|uniref:DUF488 domain-containing protein n=1 Tax=Pseudomaricurvus hydrocarbonicus TaxID=1470433 RepID=A0A9E5MGZ4_9GAMM|nr:DUF488 domain-containing protein [Aestuariicella hydrocarbonica]NHO65331.1 DUF488 domain-containing protein [Aestuariicella hydrocarbonica]
MLYSIGYATKPIDTFIAQLQRYGISALADVRSVPFSKVFFDYHQGAIEGHLKRAGIQYVYLGNELGPRSKDDNHYDDCRQVQFDRLMHSPLFQQGLARLKTGLQRGFHIGLMCAEKDPASCHRSLLIGYAFKHELGMELQHITHEGELESQQSLEERLPTMHNLEEDLFLTTQEKLKQAYQLQLKKTSYRRPE